MVQLPVHGPIVCARCFQANQSEKDLGAWHVVNDPGAWGSSNPAILILGFSKGATQAGIYKTGRFDDVAFGGRSRGNLTAILRRVHLLRPDERVDEKIHVGEKDFAFGSLVRCSLSRKSSNDNSYKSSGALIVKSFQEVPQILATCAAAFLRPLPERTRLIVMLGVDERYIRECKKFMQRLYPEGFREINAVSY